MKKRVISLMLSIVILVSMIPVSARAENHPTSGTCGKNVTWSFDEPTGTLTISGTGEMIFFSSMIDYGCPWSMFGSSITKLVVEEGVTSIAQGAFHDCPNLTDVTIADSVTSFASGAFNNTPFLESITDQDGFAVYGGNLIDYSGAGGAIKIPDGVTRLSGVFGAGDKITEVVIPSSVTSIISSFRLCDLTEVSIPNGVTEVRGSFDYCWQLYSVIIPESVTSVASSFNNCAELTSVVLPSSVTNVSDAFYGTPYLKSIADENGFSIIHDALLGYYGLGGDIVIPENVTEMSASIFMDNKSITSVVIPDGVTCIPMSAFQNTSISEITLPDSLAEICQLAFAGSENLKNIVFPKNLRSIEDGAFFNCTGLKEIRFTGNAPELVYFPGRLINRIFNEVAATVYYPENNATWTDAIHDPDWIWSWEEDSITWVPYDAGDKPQQPDPEPEIDTHNSIAELTELDYLAFSSLAYNKDLGSQSPYANIRQIYGDAWNTKWAEHTTESILVSELYGAIANWEIFETFPLSVDFYAVAFRNPVSGNVVIAYRGSENPVKMFEGNEDAIGDWVLNDLPMLFTGQLGTQFPEAQEAYETVAKEVSASGIAVTGHSLGGAWADAISALYGCKGVSVNAVPVLDVVYDKKPELYGDTFTGIENWNFIDHANQHDYLAGVNEVLFSSVPMKPYVAHKDVSGAWDPVTPHSIWTLITRNNDGAIGISEIVPFKGVQAPVIQERDWSYVNLGSVSTDILSTGLGIFKRQTSYGGNGMDEINTGIWEDILVGGSGGDRLDGSYGDDVYYYFKGDGHDYIYDIGGKDTIRLFGFDSSDSIEVAANPDEKTVEIHCNGETILSVFTKNRVESVILPDMFQIQIMNGNSVREQHDITGFFSTKKYGSHMLVACPVDIEILDASGNVVFMLNDGEIGNHYTDYGNFYIFEEADGGYGKVLDLVDGYTARIRGADTGEMDITHQIPVNGVLSEATYVSSVPVTESMIATVETDSAGKTVLVVDADGDGKTDSKLKFVSEDGEPEVLLGDVNGDGKINPKDAAMVLQHFVGKPITGFDADAADVNNDGRINPKDAAMILQRFVDKLDENFKPRG